MYCFGRKGEQKSMKTAYCVQVKRIKEEIWMKIPRRTSFLSDRKEKRRPWPPSGKKTRESSKGSETESRICVM
jgi:hypothetical protein